MSSSIDRQVHPKTVISNEGNGDQVSSHVPESEIDDGDKKSPQKQAEDNATSPDSYDDNDDDESYWTDDGGGYGDDDASYDPRCLPEMPLLKYGRILGSLPRISSSGGQHGQDGADAGAGPGTGSTGVAGGASLAVSSAAAAAASSAAAATPSPEPQPLAVPVTCQCMGRVVLGPGARVYSSDAAPAVAATQTQSSSSTGGKIPPSTAVGGGSSSSGRAGDDVTAKTRHILALGFADGAVRIVDPISGVDIVPLGKLEVPAVGIGDALMQRGGGDEAIDKTKRIVALSFDASGTFLAAINANGDAAVFELKYIAGNAMATAAVQAGGEGATTNKDDHIANLLSAWKQQQQQYQQQAMQHPAAEAAAADEGADQTNQSFLESTPAAATSLLGNLTVTLPIPTARFAYPRSTHSVPTCLAIDPTYRRRREKSVLVGFADGRLILTKRGMLFSRRSDSVIYQGVGGPSKGGTQGGIEAVTWRGCLVAWADASGIKLFDIDDMIRIAHIDRPSGARAGLYPTISSLRPTLLFERPDSLLIAWGDCIMSMLVKERAARAGTTSMNRTEGGSSTAGSGPPRAARRRVVECSVAWELDCVACGAVPLDGKHWAVLGLVPKPPLEGDDNDEKVAPHDISLPTSSAGNLVELQIISRTAGTVVAADALPLINLPAESMAESGAGVADAGIDFSLISSYCTARMDEALEVEEEELNGSVEDHDAQVAMYEALTGESTSNSSHQKQQTKFLDPHLKWSIDTIRFTEDEEESVDEQNKEDAALDDEENDADSVYSDDYNFLFRPAPATRQSSATKQIPGLLFVEPPTIIVASSRDLVLARTRDIDDAVSHARTAGMPGKALQIALRDTRMVRRHNLNHLIDDYLCSLLRLRENSISSMEPAAQNDENISPLTVSRLRLAAKATPRLLGGHVEMWRKWIKQFASIPGGLFVLREYLPVRDPKLPSKVYEMVLVQMLSELETMVSSDSGSVPKAAVLYQDAADLFLKTLRSWGPTSSISERIKIHRVFSTMQVWHERVASSASHPDIEEAKADLHNRRHQTVVGYLQTAQTSSAQVGAAKYALDKSLDGASSSVSTFDSLFGIDNVRQYLEEQLNNRVREEDEVSSATDDDVLQTDDPGRVIAATKLVALSELHFMKGQHEEALKLQLAVGANYSEQSLAELENKAIKIVNASNKSTSPREAAPNQESRSFYHHVLGHIEYHHLHWCLLETQLLSSSPTGNKRGAEAGANQSPILSLIRLVGLELSGRFLVDHCSLPHPTASTGRRQHQVSQANRSRSQTLPLDAVAEQLRPTPKILHWYLTQVFLHKPEVYVKFPNTAVPPKAVTDLHRVHLELHIKYAANSADKDRNLSEVPAYDDANTETPLLMFLKAALPHGGTRPDDVRRMLEVYREGRTTSNSPGSPSRPISGVRYPHLFARELAYVIDRCGSGSEDDSRTILQLYLEGAKSLPLAVAYAQRKKSHSTMLWDSLVSYCLDPKPQLTRKRKGKRKGSISDKEDGHLFGALLEVAARSGADLSHLVSKIPKGMQIEGLRPRLIASIADYRKKVQMHKAAADVLNKDKVDLLRELAQKSRRGTRIGLSAVTDNRSSEMEGFSENGSGADEPEGLAAKTTIDAKALIEKKGDRLSMHPERTGIIRSKALAIR